jgi:hypothetical protein
MDCRKDCLDFFTAIFIEDIFNEIILLEDG